MGPTGRGIAEGGRMARFRYRQAGKEVVGCRPARRLFKQLNRQPLDHQVVVTASAVLTLLTGC
jgi:hypothetical protein